MFRGELSSLYDFVFLVSVFLLICVSFFFLLNGCDTNSSNWKLRYVSESLSFCLQNHLWWIGWLFAVAICLQVFAIASKFHAENLRNTYGHYTAYVILLWHTCFSICAVVEFREDGTAKSNLNWWIYENVNEEQMHYFSTACFLFDLFFLHFIYFSMSLASITKRSYANVSQHVSQKENEAINISIQPVIVEDVAHVADVKDVKNAKEKTLLQNTAMKNPKKYILFLQKYRKLDFMYFFLLVVFGIFFMLQLADLARITEWLIVLILFFLQFFAYVRLRILKTYTHQTDSGLVAFRVFVALAFLFYVTFTIISIILIAPFDPNFMLDTQTNLASTKTTMKTGAEFTIMITIITVYISFIAFIF